MIQKNIDKKENLTKFQKSGHDAEIQMAFYLKRAFQENKDIHVINDLRLEKNNDYAQIDHLIIHRFGFIVLESKSVTSKVSVNAHGEWTRHYYQQKTGMPSPVEQAKRQAHFLKNFLTAESHQLLRKTLMLQASITDFKFDVLVAISDTGIIDRAKNTDISEVHKADQITETIIDLIASYASTNKNLLTLKVNYHFADSSMDKIIKFLLKSHQPKREQHTEITKTNEAESSHLRKKTPLDKEQTPEKHTEMTCSKCRSKNIEITYGKYGYYFKCKDCQGNTAIKLKCKRDNCSPRIKKRKLQFYKECSTCHISERYFENKTTEKQTPAYISDMEQ